MQQVVSITSQGQITIPASMRRRLKLDKYPKAVVQLKKGKIVVEPLPSILQLEGVLAQRAIRGKRLEEIVSLEKKAVEKAILEKYQKDR